MLHKFVEQAHEKSIIFYVSHTTNKLNFDFDVRNCFFNIINDETVQKIKSQLNKCFAEMEKKNKNVLFVADWSMANIGDCKTFFPFLEGVVNRSKSLNPPTWKRARKVVRTPAPLTLVNIFEAAKLTGGLFQRAVSMHERVYLFQENLSTFSLPTISPSAETIFPKFHALPREVLEKLVKDNLGLVTFLLLEKSPKSGYQILKDIANHFHCILSQGTLYPLLYKLEKENKITKQNGNGREVIYSLTAGTKEGLLLEKENCLQAYQHLASFFES